MKKFFIEAYYFLIMQMIYSEFQRKPELRTRSLFPQILQCKNVRSKVADKDLLPDQGITIVL